MFLAEISFWVWKFCLCQRKSWNWPQSSLFFEEICSCKDFQGVALSSYLTEQNKLKIIVVLILLQLTKFGQASEPGTTAASPRAGLGRYKRLRESWLKCSDNTRSQKWKNELEELDWLWQISYLTLYQLGEGGGRHIMPATLLRMISRQFVYLLENLILYVVGLPRS